MINGDLNPYEISLGTYLEIAFLHMMTDGQVTHVEHKIFEAGNLYSMHACVTAVNPNQQVSALRNIN